MFGGIVLFFWRFLEIITLIPTLGMLSYFVHQFTIANQLTPSYILTLFIVSVLGAVWAIVTLFRRKSTRDSAIFVSFIDLCFVGAFIAGVYELRSISKASCTNFSGDGVFSVSLGPDGVSGTSGLHLHTNKTCAMLKASFAFGIMNCIFFFISSLILLTMHRNRDRDVVVTKETYSRRRSHGSRRGHSRSGSRSGSGRHRSSRDYRTPYV
ncbi:hypothetical protein ABVK25_002839 [Lepraria finkii]|uniref:MARVEL domain-containing protein n=1 Tax=Lepraria finkii TaxID=1340010 RepID=A0ABR4BH69_9LECA